MLRLTASLFVLALAACTPAAPPAEQVPAETEALAETETADAEPPPKEPEDFQLTYSAESENYEISAEIDPAILAFDPPLAWRLWTHAKGELDAFAATADADRKTADEDAAASGGESWFRGYTLDITHEATGVFGDLISVQDMLGTYTGGAHPNYALAGGVYRKGEAESLSLDAFITDEAAFSELVIQALVTQKIERGYAAAERATVEGELRDLLGPSTEDAGAYDGRFVLEESTDAGKIGGISVLYSPYDVGSYAEGAYTATVAAADLAPILTQFWADRFGGAPAAREE